MSGSSTETEIDRHLAQLLSIESSTDFALRVRKRISEQAPARQSGGVWWMGVAAAAAFAIVVVFGSRAWRMENPSREVHVARDTVTRPVVIRPKIQAGVPAPNPPRTAQRVPRRVPLVSAGVAVGSTQPEPEVLVSRDQLRAIARLQELIRKGDLTDANSPPVGSGPDAITEIQLAPLKIAPLTVPAVDIIAGVDGSRAPSAR